MNEIEATAAGAPADRFADRVHRLFHEQFEPHREGDDEAYLSVAHKIWLETADYRRSVTES